MVFFNKFFSLAILNSLEIISDPESTFGQSQIVWISNFDIALIVCFIWFFVSLYSVVTGCCITIIYSLIGFKNIYLVGFDYLDKNPTLGHWYEYGNGIPANLKGNHQKSFIP